ncbi:MAG: shikimate kinase [Gemmatimonadota bacterium]
MPILLVGLSGSGKSTVGRLLAERWSVPFLDLDHEIERSAGMSIPEIFRLEGESGFRRREEAATRSLSLMTPIVLATGGGWMTTPGLCDEWPTAVRVWLQVSAREAAKRLASSATTRPLLVNDSPEKVLQGLLEQRLPSYGMSEYTVDTSDRTAAQVADRVAALIENAEATRTDETANPNSSLES